MGKFFWGGSAGPYIWEVQRKDSCKGEGSVYLGVYEGFTGCRETKGRASQGLGVGCRGERRSQNSWGGAGFSSKELVVIHEEMNEAAEAGHQLCLEGNGGDTVGALRHNTFQKTV